MAFAAAAIASSDFLNGRLQVPSPRGPDNVTCRFPITLATVDLALNTIGQVGILPAGCVPVEVRIDAADLDSGAAAAIYQVAIGNLALQDAAGAVSADAKNTLLSTITADGGGVWGDSGAAVNTAFDRSLTRTLNNMTKVTKKDYDRALCIKVSTAPTAAVIGELALTLVYKNA